MTHGGSSHTWEEVYAKRDYNSGTLWVWLGQALRDGGECPRAPYTGITTTAPQKLQEHSISTNYRLLASLRSKGSFCCCRLLRRATATAAIAAAAAVRGSSGAPAYHPPAVGCAAAAPTCGGHRLFRRLSTGISRARQPSHGQRLLHHALVLLRRSLWCGRASEPRREAVLVRPRAQRARSAPTHGWTPVPL